MEFFELIKERYSCRNFSDTKIKREVLEKVLEAGRLAPTAKNLQEQKIYVIESEEMLKKVDEFTACRYNAPTVLAVAFNKNNVYQYIQSKRTSGIEDATIVATHMILGAKDVGLESCWLNAFNPEGLEKALGLPENEQLLMLMDLGYPTEEAKPSLNHTSRKDISETVKYI